MGPTAFEILQELRAIRELLERFAAREYPAEARVHHNSYCLVSPLRAAPEKDRVTQPSDTKTTQ